LSTLEDNDLVIFITLSGENPRIFSYLKLIETHKNKVLISGKEINSKCNVKQKIVFEINESNL
jgi:DNA-binding MurR/RpiR family transcriptional regulator